MSKRRILGIKNMKCSSVDEIKALMEATGLSDVGVLDVQDLADMDSISFEQAAALYGFSQKVVVGEKLSQDHLSPDDLAEIVAMTQAAQVPSPSLRSTVRYDPSNFEYVQDDKDAQAQFFADGMSVRSRP